jgi:hypothetical protein
MGTENLRAGLRVEWVAEESLEKAEKKRWRRAPLEQGRNGEVKGHRYCSIL